MLSGSRMDVRATVGMQKSGSDLTRSSQCLANRRMRSGSVLANCDGANAGLSQARGDAVGTRKAGCPLKTPGIPKPTLTAIRIWRGCRRKKTMSGCHAAVSIFLFLAGARTRTPRKVGQWSASSRIKRWHVPSSVVHAGGPFSMPDDRLMHVPEHPRSQSTTTCSPSARRRFVFVDGVLRTTPS